MGNSASRVVGCLVPSGFNEEGLELGALEPLDEGLGHSFCYVRPVLLDSPAITPSISERFTAYSSTLDSETPCGSFRQEVVEERPCRHCPETTFKTISGASVSANASSARTGNTDILFMVDAKEPAASFESTSSFAAIPLQLIPQGSGPLKGFMSGPLERGFASGPLSFGSGPLDKNVFMSGPMDGVDRVNFSAPLAGGRKKGKFGHLVRSVSKPMKQAFSRSFVKHLPYSNRIRRWFLNQPLWLQKEVNFQLNGTGNYLDAGSLGSAYSGSSSLQWAHGKAGEDRVHIVLSEEQGWLFVGIYDGFSGPDAPDFLMSNLYKAIDKELEGLLWEYEDITEKPCASTSICESDNAKETLHCVGRECKTCDSVNSALERQCVKAKEDGGGIESFRKTSKEIGEEYTEKGSKAAAECHETVGGSRQNSNVDTCKSNMERSFTFDSRKYVLPSISDSYSDSGRKNMKLFELLQMDLMSEFNDMQTSSSSDRRCRCDQEDARLSVFLQSGVKINNKGTLVQERAEVKRCQPVTCLPNLNHMPKGPMDGEKLKRMGRKQKSVHKKLLSWSYDWHRNQNIAGAKKHSNSADFPKTIRRCKAGSVDHATVLDAMANALKKTETAYMQMVESALDRNPELALMGSCVLVMLVKNEDMYIMNVGDSRLILAQDRSNQRPTNLDILKVDTKLGNLSAESLMRVESDRISEEPAIHNRNIRSCRVDKNQEVSMYNLKTNAIQLTSDHSTSVEGEVLRIKSEHAEDSQAVFKDRVKGQLKVTRAFGAAFLKKPQFNDALLEMFRIDYIGSSPYISCTPSVRHHRLSSKDRFLILSSDGLYQYFSNEEAVSHVAWFIDNIPGGDPAQYLITELLLRAAKENGMDFHELLGIPHGDRRKYHDDVSVMVISLEGRIWRSCG